MFPDPEGRVDGGHGEPMVDSSPQIMRLEQEFDGRSVVPDDRALAFIDALIEDFADEWLTKPMYHYRWSYQPDIDKAGKLLPISRDLQIDEATAKQSYNWVTERQIGRRALVGSTETNTPTVEDSYLRVLDILSRLFDERDFLLGDRPGRGDFGLFGQLLTEAGRGYAQFMVANAKALMSGADEVVCEIDGREYRQGPFKYQGKCLGWLRDAYAALPEDGRTRVDEILDGTGCEVLFA